LFLLLIIQAGVLIPLHLAPVNLILVTVAVAVLLADFNLGLSLTLIGGLLLDFSSGSPDGLITMSLLAVFLVLYFVVNTVLAKEPNQKVLFTAVFTATIGYFLFFLLFNQLFSLFHLSTSLGNQYLLTRQLSVTLLFNLILTYPILKYYQWVEKLTLKFKSSHV
jgi:hypothetical protein